MQTIYLAGPIHGATDAEAHGWRETVMSALDGQYAFLNPMHRDYRGREDENVDAIVRGDLDDIRAADIVLVYAYRATWGTAMEIRAASHEFAKPVHVIAPPPISPWLRYHATELHTTLGDAVLRLARLAELSAASPRSEPRTP